MSFDLIIVSVVILLGIIFLLLEIFLLPGVGIAGIAGLLFVLGGIVYAYLYIGPTAGNILLVATALLIGGGFVALLKSKSLEKIGLKAEIKDSVDNSDLQKIAVGDTGSAVSRLNPMGKVMVNGIMFEAKSLDGEMIDEDSEIEVVKINTSNIIVKSKETII
ncbi:MAG: NfeD family protein [Petrimonas sp.]|nr:NfeD family protein [Petrimonas sp.]